jgi:hypothetical protein
LIYQYLTNSLAVYPQIFPQIWLVRDLLAAETPPRGNAGGLSSGHRKPKLTANMKALC